MYNTPVHQVAGRNSVREGDLLWTPSPERVERSHLTAFTRFAEQRTGQTFDDYTALWRWSTTELEEFWQAVWDFFGVRSSAPHTAVLESCIMPGARWFPGARLNFAEHLLRMERPGEAALLYSAECAPLRELSWDEFAGQIRTVATHLRSIGVRPGDRVVAYLPNVPAAMVAMVAAASVGAVWASVSPDFGAKGATDRLGQLAPTVLLAADGYRYGDRDFDRRGEVARLVAGLPTLREVVHVPVLGLETDGATWAEVLGGPSVPAEEFACEQVPFDQPLWVLFSSGTTGLPKPIVHGHGGILLEHLKLHALHHDLRAGDRAFFFTTTGWMMWNFMVSMPLVGAAPVLYDGNPAHPDVDVLWRIAQDSRARLFGASPTYVELMQKAGVVPRERFDLSALDVVMPAGSPVRAGGHRVVLRRRQGRPGRRHRQRRHRRLHRAGRRRAYVAGPGGRDPGPLARGSRRGLGRRRAPRRRTAWRAGNHSADAVDAAVPVGRRGRRPLPRQLLRDLPRRLAAR